MSRFQTTRTWRVLGGRVRILVGRWRFTVPGVTLRVVPRPGEGDPLDAAMWTVWLEGKWRWVTAKMSTEEREAAVAAVLRADRVLKGDEPEEDLLTRYDVAWWESSS